MYVLHRQCPLLASTANTRNLDDVGVAAEFSGPSLTLTQHGSEVCWLLRPPRHSPQVRKSASPQCPGFKIVRAHRSAPSVATEIAYTLHMNDVGVLMGRSV